MEEKGVPRVGVELSQGGAAARERLMIVWCSAPCTSRGVWKSVHQVFLELLVFSLFPKGIKVRPVDLLPYVANSRVLCLLIHFLPKIEVSRARKGAFGEEPPPLRVLDTALSVRACLPFAAGVHLTRSESPFPIRPFYPSRK
ncbi:hypothetical protein CDAR_217381 [Caerostris darwini]|uniref:Uncharacterized protein n=1 Tax=Caerostris darwini TaxID=1538125 RepID=A0AAV4SDZ7_9ARAC|nr:hypothetical protein CDAR_217381 [Caerostris darwini]